MRCFLLVLFVIMLAPFMYGVTYTINPTGGNYPSFTAAFSYLNGLTVLPAGGIEFLVPANLTFTELPDPLTILATETSPVVFHKSGTGANPVIFNDTCPNTRGIIMMVNCAWITFDGIDLADPIITDANQYAFGYVVETGTHITIKNNHVRDFANMGIYIRLASTYATVYNNMVTHSPGFTSNATSIYGIDLQYNALADQFTIERNIVSGLKGGIATSTLYGIRLGQVNGKIINNFVSLTSNNNDTIYGIRADNRAGKTIDVDFNTVLISGTATDDGYALATFGGESSSTFHIRNNIFLNNRTGFNQYCVYLALITPVYVVDYNVYYSGDEVNTFLGRWFQTEITGFSDWQTTSNFDIHSKLKNLTFVDPTLGDLHLSGNAIGDYDLSGTPIATIQNDIDNDTRFAAHPYRGADENTTVPLNVEVSIQPSTLNFGIVPIGTSSILSITISNSGALPITVDTLTTLLPYQIRFTNGVWGQALTGFNLAVTTIATVEVKYSPTVFGDNPGVLYIETNVPGSEIVGFPLNGQGGDAEINVTPSSLAFGNNLMNQPSTPQVLNVQNNGNLPLQVSSIICPAGFELRYPPTANWSNTISGFALLPNLSADIEVRFYPTQLNAYSGNIIITSNDVDEPTVSVAVSGTGVAVSPPRNLVAIPGNQTVTLSWDAPLRFSRDGRPFSSYRIYRNASILTETTNNSYIDNSVVNLNQYTYYLTALYTNPTDESAPSNSVTTMPFNSIPVIAATPDSLTFGRVPRNAISDSLTFVIENNGWVDLQITSISTPSCYTISLDGMIWDSVLTNLTIIPGADTLIYIRFNPIEITDYNSNLTINSNDITYPAYLVHLFGTATGIVLSMPQIFFAGVWYSEAAWGDYDNDNDLDLLLTGYDYALSQNRIYTNELNDTFTESLVDTTGVGNSMANWVDFDRDGDLDFFVSGQHLSAENFFAGLYRNDNGVFSLVQTGITPLRGGSSEWGDFDNDGDPDLLITGTDVDGISHADLYRNDGNGVFTLLNSGLPPVDISDAKFCDYDNDGDLDIAITGSHDSGDYITKIFRNDGVLPLTEAYNAPVGLRYADLVWGDYDNDGDEDLLVTGSFVNEENSITRIYRNDGNSLFTVINPGIPGIRQGDIIWTDLDNDGWLDIFMNGVFNTGQWIGWGYLDLGGEYVYADSIDSFKYPNIVPGDYDNDNDMDFFMSGRYASLDYRSNIYRNDYPIPQIPPTPPLNLFVAIDSSLVTFTWSPGSDAETPTPGLTYNLYVGHSNNTDEHYTAMANIATGYRRIPAAGNMWQKTSFSMRLPNGVYYWGVQTIDNSLKGSPFAQGIQFEIQGVSNNDTIIPTLVTKLEAIYPNPFNPETTISYNLRSKEHVQIEIYNLRGQLVKTLEENTKSAGKYITKWDGTDNNGSSVGSGIYFCHFTAGKVKSVKKLSLIK